MPRSRLLYNIVFFVALLSTAVAMGAALAHALELPNKIGMTRDNYFVVQQVYAGWNQLAYLLIVELVAIIAVIVMGWSDSWVRWAAIAALVCLIAAQAVFWTYTYPANVATENWTMIPENWDRLRSEWEYSHFAGAIFQVLAISALAVAALARTNP